MPKALWWLWIPQIPKAGHRAIYILATLSPAPGSWLEMQDSESQPRPSESEPVSEQDSWWLVGTFTFVRHWSTAFLWGTVELSPQLACDMGRMRTHLRASVFSFVKWRHKAISSSHCDKESWLQSQDRLTSRSNESTSLSLICKIAI